MAQAEHLGLAISNRPRDQDNVEVVCGCTNLTLRELQERLATDATLTFDRLLEVTGAGGKCTACLLDLEYHFVNLPRIVSKGGASDVVAVDDKTAVRKFKDKLYRFLDNLAPMLPIPLPNIIPVIGGPQQVQWLWLANQSLFFEGKICAPDMVATIVVRDSEGKVRHRDKLHLGEEENVRVNISQYLPPAEPDAHGAVLPSIGSVIVHRRWGRPGFRGTTRPQFEIVAPGGACAVHSQAATGPATKWFSLISRPKDERVFLSVVNAHDDAIKFELDYPYLSEKTPGVEPAGTVTTIPPQGARLIEVRLPQQHHAALEGHVFSLRWRVSGPHKVYVICSTPTLDRFSIDHA